MAADEFLLVYYGYIYRGKGIETLLRAVATVSQRLPELRLAIVGGSVGHKANQDFNDSSEQYMLQVQSLASELGIEKRVIWTGLCPPEREEGSLYLRAGDVAVLPFDSGVFLNNSSFAAAVTHALPVITTRGAWVEEPLVDERNVLLCPPRDPDAMAKAIEMLAVRGDLREALGRGAERLAHEWFSWDSVVERTLNALGDGRK